MAQTLATGSIAGGLRGAGDHSSESTSTVPEDAKEEEVMRTYSMLIAALAVAVAFGLGAGSEVVVAQAVQDVHQATVYQPPYEQTEAFTFVADGAVRELQTLPGQHGYPVAVDGDFGPQTLAAVRAFQKTKGPDVDGIVGPQTWAARRSRRRRAGARPRGSGSAAASHEQCRRRKRR